MYKKIHVTLGQVAEEKDQMKLIYMTSGENSPIDSSQQIILIVFKPCGRI